jgi:hypothetical protein
MTLFKDHGLLVEVCEQCKPN